MERVKVGMTRYKPYVKKVGEFVKSGASKVSSITDTIEKSLNSPFVGLIRDNLPDEFKLYVDELGNINKFVGGVSKSINDVLDGDIKGGLNKAISHYKTSQDTQKVIDKKYNALKKKNYERRENLFKNHDQDITTLTRKINNDIKNSRGKYDALGRKKFNSII